MTSDSLFIYSRMIEELNEERHGEEEEDGDGFLF